MVFSSLIFIFGFLPVFLFIYYLIPDKYKNLFIVIGGYLFYSWGSPRFALILLLTIIIDYYLSQLIFLSKNKTRKILTILSVLMNVGLLFYFKYSNFFFDQLNYLLQFIHLPIMPWVEVILPIGISFTVFQELSYIIEIYRGKIKPAKTLIDFTAYLMLFPHVIAGPIVRYIDIATQLQKRYYSVENFFYGIYRFSFGLAKKVLIANAVSPIADAIFNLDQTQTLTPQLAWLGILAYTMQIYFDFSGYSDMAIGLAKMLGFDFKENFNQPYVSRNITDFWRRWHISLSTWMKEYIYIPLGGSKTSTTRTGVNLMIVFLISGLWHGANWNFIFWGGLHGILLIFDKLFWLKISEKLSSLVNIILTFIVINISWVFFRLENLSAGWSFVVKMFAWSDWFTPLVMRQAEIASHKAIIVLILALVISFLPATKFYFYSKEFFNKLPENKKSFLIAMSSISLLILSIMELTNAQFNPFIYFRF